MKDLRPYVCTLQNCSKAGETYASRSAFLYHGLHCYGNNKSSLKQGQPGLSNTCVFCEEVLSMAGPEERSRHVGRHMEEIAFMVVTKPYEDWEFYSDASSVIYQGSYQSSPRRLNKADACRE